MCALFAVWRQQDMCFDNSVHFGWMQGLQQLAIAQRAWVQCSVQSQPPPWKCTKQAEVQANLPVLTGGLEQAMTCVHVREKLAER